MTDELAIKSAEFNTSAVRPHQYPQDDVPEVAFAGRSNVGKSSLINCLVQRKKLVRTSRTPGRTQLINFFDINNSFRFVDLPGYGYAKVAESVRQTWGPMIETYLETRKNLRGVVSIIDFRHPPTPDDLTLWSWLQERKIPAIPVLTKADKLPRGKWNPLAKNAAQVLGIALESIIMFSAETQQGRTELIGRIRQWLSE
ncbi:MAG: ribosome biogenesis GTP-binding protein YihA/YsxC [Syntrophobacteraceae bacterium]